MPIITNTAYLVPRGTSQLVVCPAYEKPLLQVKYNTGVGDRDKWVKTLAEIPKDLPPAAHRKELDCEAEMTRLAATYGVDLFRKAYPIDESFIKAFEACQVAVLPGAEGAIPNMAPTADAQIAEFLELNVPSMDQTKAAILVENQFTVSNIAATDARSIGAATGLSANLIRATVEAAKKAVEAAFAPAPRGAPSAPSLMRATSMEKPAST